MQRIKTEKNVGFELSLRGRCGFTLVELLVVVAVIAIVASVGAGMYIGTIDRLHLEKAARNFLLTARYGRIMAIEKQRRYIIVLDEENGGFSLVTTDFNPESEQFEQGVVKDYYCKPFEFEGAVKFEDMQLVPTGVEETEADGESAGIEFRPDGTAQAVVVQIGDGKMHYTISISAATGKAKIHEGTIENAEIGTIDLDAQ